MKWASGEPSLDWHCLLIHLHSTDNKRGRLGLLIQSVFNLIFIRFSHWHTVWVARVAHAASESCLVTLAHSYVTGAITLVEMWNNGEALCFGDVPLAVSFTIRRSHLLRRTRSSRCLVVWYSTKGNREYSHPSPLDRLIDSSPTVLRDYIGGQVNKVRVHTMPLKFATLDFEKHNQNIVITCRCVRICTYMHSYIRTYMHTSLLPPRSVFLTDMRVHFLLWCWCCRCAVAIQVDPPSLVEVYCQPFSSTAPSLTTTQSDFHSIPSGGCRSSLDCIGSLFPCW